MGVAVKLSTPTLNMPHKTMVKRGRAKQIANLSTYRNLACFCYHGNHNFKNGREGKLEGLLDSPVLMRNASRPPEHWEIKSQRWLLRKPTLHVFPKVLGNGVHVLVTPAAKVHQNDLIRRHPLRHLPEKKKTRTNRQTDHREGGRWMSQTIPDAAER